MIKKIKTINNFAAFNNFDWDASVLSKGGRPESFEKLNILYGRNYSGKTTLSRILGALENRRLPDRYDNPQFEVVLDDNSIISNSMIATNRLNIRVFNEDFIRANLHFLIDPESEIAPFAILGANNAEIEAEIDTLKAEIGLDFDSRETGLYKQLIDAKTEAREAKSKFDTACSELDVKLSDKAINRTSGIKYNSDKYGDLNYSVVKIKKDIDIVLAGNYTQLTAEQKDEYETTIREQAKTEIPRLSVPNTLFGKYCQKAESLLSRQIGTSNKIAELILDVALNDWIKQGAEILEGQAICAFCGNPVSDDRWEAIHAHFDEESKKLENELNSLVSQISAEKASLQPVFTLDKTKFYAKHHQQVDEFVKARNETVQKYCQSLDDLVKQLQKRQSQITVPMQFLLPNDYSDALGDLISDFNTVIKGNNGFADDLSAAKAAAQTALRLQEISEFCAMIGYEDKTTRIDELKTNSDKAIEVIQQIEADINAKKQTLHDKLSVLNDEETGALRVNKYLNDYFGQHFVTLKAEKVAEGEKRVKFSIMRNDKPAFNLSEGECSLIAFCYFMAKLDDIDTNGKNPIIWIDDPISSLDSNHIFYIYSLLDAELASKANFEQLFISTHNLDFLKYLRRLNTPKVDANGDDKKNKNGKRSFANKQYFIVSRQMQGSTIGIMPNYLKNYATEFNYLFERVYKCSQIESVDDSNFELVYAFGNNARKFLEIYLYFKYPEYLDDNEDDRLERFFGNNPVPRALVNRLSNEYSHLQGAIERAARPIEIEEFSIAAKKIVERLQEIDASQYNSLLRSIGVTP